MANPFETPGMFSWFELMTCDVEGAKQFYGELFEWEFETDDKSGMEYTLIKKKDTDPFAGIFDRRHAMVENKEQIPPHWGNYVTVENIEESTKKAKELGADIIVPPTAIPNVGIFSVLQDPQGAVFSLFEYHISAA